MRHRLEVIGEATSLRQQVGIVGREPIGADEPLQARLRQLRQPGRNQIAPRPIDDERRKVRLGEVAVIMRLFLAAHRIGPPLCRVEQPGLLHDTTAVVDDIDLPLDLVLERFL